MMMNEKTPYIVDNSLVYETNSKKYQVIKF